MFRIIPIAHACRFALATACIASLLPLPSQSQNAVLRFSGRITEPMCSTSTHPAADASSLRLNMNCHSDQSVQFSFDTPPGLPDRLLFTHEGKPLEKGQQLSLALKGRQQNQVNIDVAMLDPASTHGSVPTPLMVTMSYR